MKKYFTLVMACVILFTSTITVSAKEVENAAWYNLNEEKFDIDKDIDCIAEGENISLYSKYIMNIQTTIKNFGSGKVGLRADVFCADVVKTINIHFTLQKKSGTKWIDVASASASDSNVDNTAKSATASGVSAGTYRAVASVMVTDKYGYAESLTGYSGSITIS